jgi:hypothetical protein
MATEWILRAGDGKNFLNSSDYRIWGINSSANCGKHFLKNVKQGDRLWFVKNKSHGKIIAVGTYKSHNERVLGPLVNTTMTDEELGWSETRSDTEVHYTHLYELSNCNLLTHLKAQTEIVKYKREKYEIDLPTEYENILRSWDDCF